MSNTRNVIAENKWSVIGGIVFILACCGYGAYTDYNEAHITESCVNAGGSWTDVNPGFGTTMGCVAK